MTRKLYSLPLLFFFGIGLTGCWDQNLLKDSNLITCVGIDQAKGGKVEVTATTNIGIPEVGVARQGQGQGGQIVTAIGDTVRNARIMIDRKTTKSLNASELQILMISENFARANVLAPLNVFFRDRLSNLNSKIIIVQGSPAKLMEAVSKKNSQVGRFLADMLQGEEKRFIIPSVNLGSIIGDILPPGKDALLPLMKIQGGEAVMAGTAMIHNEKMKGALSSEETILALIFTRHDPNEAIITLKVQNGKSPASRNYMTIAVVGKKEKVRVFVDDHHKIVAQLRTVLTAHIQEFDELGVYTEENIQKWNRELSDQFTEQATNTIHKLQENNCDLYGIGERLRALHPTIWKSLDWDKDYGKVEFQVLVQVDLLHTGGIS
ncbi:Ger(x)C family spore germination protein [Paenibacillus eucommiae]|uniref:Ger(X)C family germination protein n=1 Tax=Paenibacillus eucommiae TaxID=1355755 RepID=A0ABS4JAQ5_9BACL|nr:Ger(x)C family spore germination protein [Paenibacillus eucommiae]MBP1996927.1 Ger(x)C family germination protein [Paenibacillus eucommiae]